MQCPNCKSSNVVLGNDSQRIGRAAGITVAGGTLAALATAPLTLGASLVVGIIAFAIGGFGGEIVGSEVGRRVDERAGKYKCTDCGTAFQR